MYYTIYKITNNLNDKIYIGMHKTNDLDDGYYGSGKLIKRAIEKYGIENFSKEYIAIFDNSGDMVNLEQDIVNEDFVKREDTYNLKEGGIGGWDHIMEKCQSVEHMTKMSHLGKEARCEKLKYLFENDPEWVSLLTKKRIQTTRLKYGNDAFKGFEGKQHSDESKAQMSKTKKDMNFQKGSNNSQYGTCWIHSLTLKETKRIKKEELNDWTSKGWIKGRKMKF